jgi:protein-disulfide isomerase
LGRPEFALATEAAWCAADQDGFFPYQHALFENFGVTPASEMLVDLAVSVGLEEEIFAQCLSSRTHRADVEQARRMAARRAVNSTPTFFINDRRVEGNQPYNILQSIIDQELGAAQ